MDVLILLIVLRLQLLNSLVLLGLNFGDLSLSLGFHNLSQTSHFGLVLLLDFVGNALIFLTLGSCQSIKVLIQSILVLRLTNFLLLGLDLESAQVLL
jgi:hypothetical protein